MGFYFDFEVDVMLEQFVFALLAFAGIVLSGAFAAALLSAPSLPSAPQTKTQPPGCNRSLTKIANSFMAAHTRVESVAELRDLSAKNMAGEN